MVLLALGVPAHWHAPAWWLGTPSYRDSAGYHRATGAWCIHEHEGAWNAIGHSRDRYGNPITYYGGMQFLLSTWRSVGGVTRPDLASPREQLFRAWLVYRRDGSSWREWGTRGKCGLK